MIKEYWKKNHSLKEYNTWRVGGNAEYFYQPTDFDQLKNSYLYALKNAIPISILGEGSNVLISDLGIEGLVLSLKSFNHISSYENSDYFYLEAQAGVSKTQLLKAFLEKELSPALLFAGLPGNLAGGIVMNAGVSTNISPHEFSQIVDSFEVLKPSGELVTYSHNQINWSYRQTTGWQPGIIISAQLKWPLKKEINIKDTLKTLNRKRLLSQPLDKPSCGSVFTNPKEKNVYAGKLIEDLGLKGFRIGKAEVSTKHANFIVTEKGATASDVKKIIEHIILVVKEATGYQLKPEVVLMGRW
jgi:UDP-N-acetylmuramate dehydrogenase